MQDSGTKYCGSVETSVVYKQICLFSAWKKNHVNYFFSLKKIKNYLMSLFNIVYVVGKIVKWQKKASKIQLEMLQLCPLKIYLITFEKKLLSNEEKYFFKVKQRFLFFEKNFFFFG